VPRIGLVTALLPPSIGGTEILVWRLFRDYPELAVVSGAAPDRPSASESRDVYSALDAPTLALPYPRLRGYRYGLAPVLGGYSIIWLANALRRATGFLRAQQVDHIVSISHHGPFALLGLLAARQMGIGHTLYILDAWEEAATGPIERQLIKLGLRSAATMPRSRLAVVSPALGDHYKATFGFREAVWIPNPAPLPVESTESPVTVKPFVLFTGGIKPFNLQAIRAAAKAIVHCRVAEKLIVTGESGFLADCLRANAELHDRIEFRRGSRTDIALLQREAAVLLIATNVDDSSETTRGYLPGRLPEYVATRRPILVIGPERSDASRAVRHWRVGVTTSSQDERELADLFDSLTSQSSLDHPQMVDAHHDSFLELFSREQARSRLWGEPARALSSAAAELAQTFEDSAPSIGGR
jgi:hypothetical protein